MPASVPILRRPVFGGFQPDAAGRCAVCGRRKPCSASCRVAAWRLRPRKKRVRHTPPAGPAWKIADLSPATRQLITVARVLYGEDWRRPTARELGVDVSRVRQWLRGQGSPTIHQVLRLLDAAKRRSDAISRAYTDVVEQLPGRPANSGDFPPVGHNPPPDRPHLTLWQPGGLRSR